MNGIVEITVKKKKHVLRFSYPGCMEFEARVFKNPTQNQGKLLIDLIYSGIYGECMRSEKPAPDYGAVYDLTDSLSEEKDYSDQMDKVWKCYNESKWGKEYLAKLAELGKKKVEESE